MKIFNVWIKPRGAEFKFSSPRKIWVRAFTAKEARTTAINRVGDIYKVVKCVEDK